MPYRPQVRMRVGPAPLPTQVDPTPFLERLQQTSAVGAAARLAAQQRAAKRKVELQMQREKQQQDVLTDLQNKINQKTLESQTKVQKFQQETDRYMTNIQLRDQQMANTRRQQQQALGAARNYTNPNFGGSGYGQLPVQPTGPASKQAAAIINEALKYRGRPYVWGGSNPQTSFDCSGLVQWAYKKIGITLPRVSNQQANFGRKVPLQALRPGDLVAWDNSGRNNGADHIAIFIGNGQIIEAARRGTPIRVSSLYDTERAWGVQILS